MTFEEAKDHVAKKHGHKNWKELNKLTVGDFFIDEIAELYAQSKQAEAWDEGWNACVNSTKVVGVFENKTGINFEKVFNPYKSLPVNPNKYNQDCK
ncbi:MAG TPA: hypothetical protein VL443_30145 [Cyclobacteriaceae bacterium]|jgi:hypothetical protein|nr:hypothetical protein [Cyclobacteriaceae bacterium]